MPIGQFPLSAAGTSPVLVANVPPGCTATFSVLSGTAYLGSNVGASAATPVSLVSTGVPVTSTAPYSLTHGITSPQVSIYGAVSSGTVTVAVAITSLLSG
jgi:hypothetical protein